MTPIDPDPERTDYITERWDLRRVEALALQYAELGFTAAGIAKLLDVTEGTARSYLTICQTTINKNVTETISPSKKKYDTFPEREVV